MSRSFYQGRPFVNVQSTNISSISPLREPSREFGFDMPELSVDLFLKDNSIVRMGIPPIRIEIITGISGVKFDECYTERVVDEIDNIMVNIISLRHLKTNKKVSGRYKDLNDLENLP